MNEKLLVQCIHCLNFHQIIHNTTVSTHQQVLGKRISCAPAVSLAVNSLQLYPEKRDIITTSSAAMNI